MDRELLHIQCKSFSHTNFLRMIFISVLSDKLWSFLFFFFQLPKAFQGDENQGSAFMVQTDPQRSSLPAHADPTHHPSRFKVWQHLHNRANGFSEDWRPGIGHTKEGLVCQECYRYDYDQWGLQSRIVTWLLNAAAPLRNHMTKLFGLPSKRQINLN